MVQEAHVESNRSFGYGKFYPAKTNKGPRPYGLYPPLETTGGPHPGTFPPWRRRRSPRRVGPQPEAGHSQDSGSTSEDPVVRVAIHLEILLQKLHGLRRESSGYQYLGLHYLFLFMGEDSKLWSRSCLRTLLNDLHPGKAFKEPHQTTMVTIILTRHA